MNMSNHRLFLAIKLPQELLAQLHSYQEQLNPQIFRVVEEDKLHLTLIFLGYVEKEKIKTIQDITLEITQNFQPQPIRFLETGYGPNPKFPRLIWLEGFPNQSLEQLKRVLEKELRDKAKITLEEENRLFLPHITLARIKTPPPTFNVGPGAFNAPPSNLPPKRKINTQIHFSFSPPSLWLMESQLHKEGAQYIDLAEFPFKN